jgi:toxin ParE1/3/4
MPSSLNVVLSEPAEEDFIGLLQYSWERWGDTQPLSYASQVESALENLSRFPSIGKERDECFSGCRSYLVGRHCIYYQVVAGTILVVRILHQSIDATSVFDAAESD